MTDRKFPHSILGNPIPLKNNSKYYRFTNQSFNKIVEDIHNLSNHIYDVDIFNKLLDEKIKIHIEKFMTLRHPNVKYEVQLTPYISSKGFIQVDLSIES